MDRFISCSSCSSRITDRKSGLCLKCYQVEFFSKPENRDSTKKRSKEFYTRNKKHCADRQRAYFLNPQKRFSRYQKDAARRGYEFKLSFDQFVSATSSGCFYCGDIGPKTGLDRLDSGGHYTLNNVVGCCWPCNKIKSDQLTFEEMCVAMKAITKLRNESRCL